MSGIDGGGIQSSPITSGTLVSNIFNIDLAMVVGTVTALTGTVFTSAVTGLLTTDQVTVQCQGALTAGAAIGNARCSTNGVLSINFITAVALGVTLGSLTYRITVFR